MNEVYWNLIRELRSLEHGIIAIDGRCGSGKTGFAALCGETLDCNIIHMDDFYLPLGERQVSWRDIPGGNMDFQRLIREVLEPIHRGETVTVRPYDCGKKAYGPERVLPPKPLTIIEGSYSHFPELRKYYDKMIFLTCGNEIQKKRLLSREGEKYAMFEQVWIPMEENYLFVCPTPPEAMVVDTSGMF